LTNQRLIFIFILLQGFLELKTSLTIAKVLLVFIGIPSLAVNTLKWYLYLVPLPVPHYVRGNLLPVSNLSDNKTALSSKKVYGCFIVEYTVNVRFVFYVLWGGDDLRKKFFIFFVGMKSRISKNKRCKNALRNLGIQLGICNSLKGAKT